MQNISHLSYLLSFISHHIFNANASTRSQTFNLTKPLKNVEFKTLCMRGSATQVCLKVSQCIGCINKSNISIAPVCPISALDTAQISIFLHDHQF